MHIRVLTRGMYLVIFRFYNIYKCNPNYTKGFEYKVYLIINIIRNNIEAFSIVYLYVL